jgi:hypothetical protein
VKSILESVLPCLLLASAAAWAQDQTPNQTPNQTPPAAPAATPSATLPPPREVSSTVNTGTGLSIEPFYWYTKDSAPVLRGGASNITGISDTINYPSKPSRSIGGRITVPVSKNGTLRASYFQTKSNGFTTAPKNLNIFGVPVTGGDILDTRYRVQNVKLSYDYLTYFWKRGNEIQHVSVANEVDDYVVDSAGVFQDINPATGTKSLFLPTFGLGLEHTLSRHFRWEVRGSGFGLWHRADIVDAEGALAFRVSHVELLAGGRYYHFKTSPKAAQFDTQSLYGPYVSLRFYWKKQ